MTTEGREAHKPCEATGGNRCARASMRASLGIKQTNLDQPVHDLNSSANLAPPYAGQACKSYAVRSYNACQTGVTQGSTHAPSTQLPYLHGNCSRNGQRLRWYARGGRPGAYWVRGQRTICAIDNQACEAASQSTPEGHTTRNTAPGAGWMPVDGPPLGDCLLLAHATDVLHVLHVVTAPCCAP